MKSEDPLREIDGLLRAHTPDPQPPPGLESRILRALDRHERPVAFRFRGWWVLPPLAALVAVMLWHESPVKPSSTASRNDAPSPVFTTPQLPEIALVDEVNPLQNESLALQRDAERAGRFLIDCLPSLDSQEN